MRTKQTPSETMDQSEILPQSMVDIKTVVLKPRLDNRDIQLIGEKIGPCLFSRFGFKPKSEVIRLLCVESYFEPFLIIGGKYSLDYCKRHVFNVDVENKTNKLFVAGQEFNLEKSDSTETSRKIKLKGEEYVHYERQAYFILDRMKREISPEKLPMAPFDILRRNPECESHFKRINMSDDKQIHFLKMKIAERPADVAEIIKENFDITDRTLAYYPMYQLTFENYKNKKESIVSINAITGEIRTNGNRKFSLKAIVSFPKSPDSQIEFPSPCKEAEIEPILRTNLPDTKDNENNIQKEEKQGPLRSAEDVETIYGDMEIPSGTTINKILIVKGALRIGDYCRVHGELKVSGDIAIGADTIINGDLKSGGNVFIGARSLITGSVEAEGVLEIEENAVVEGAAFPTYTS